MTFKNYSICSCAIYPSDFFLLPYSAQKRHAAYLVRLVLEAREAGELLVSEVMDRRGNRYKSDEQAQSQLVVKNRHYHPTRYME
jgi:hypothetical protein